MPGQHCPVCGAAPTVGCACSHNPDLEDTTVLPHIEGPPLVRPYVPAATSMPAQDPFVTAVMPQAPAYEQTPHRHETLRVPAPPQSRPVAPVRQPAASGSRARPKDSPGRRRVVVITAGAGLAAVGAGLAFAMSPSSASAPGNDQALPASVGSYQPADTTAPPSAAPSVSAKTASASPSRTKASRSPSASPSPTVSVSPSAAPSPSPTPSSSPSTSATPTIPAPSQSATTPRTLSYGMSGPDVSDLQQQLADVLYWAYDQSLVTGTFDSRTRQAVRDFQRLADVRGDASGVFGPRTRAALANYTG